VAATYANASRVAAGVLQLAAPAPGAATALAFAAADVGAAAPLLAAAVGVTSAVNGTWVPLMGAASPHALFALSSAARSAAGATVVRDARALRALAPALAGALSNASDALCGGLEDWLLADSGAKYGRMSTVEVSARAVGAKVLSDPAYRAAAGGDGGAAAAMLTSTAHLATLNAEFSTYELLVDWVYDLGVGPAADLNGTLAALDAAMALLSATKLPAANESAWSGAFNLVIDVEAVGRSLSQRLRSLASSAVLLAGVDANGTLGGDPAWSAALSSASGNANASLPAIAAALPALDAASSILAAWLADPSAALADAFPSLPSWAAAAANARHAATSLQLAALSFADISAARASALNGSVAALVALPNALEAIAASPGLALALQALGDAFNATQGLGADAAKVLAQPALAALREVRANLSAVQAALSNTSALLDAEITMRSGFEGVLHLCRAAFVMADWSAGTAGSEGYFPGLPTSPRLLDVAVAPLLEEGVAFVLNVTAAEAARAPSAMLLQDDATRVASLLRASTPLLWPMRLGNMGAALSTLNTYSFAAAAAANESTALGWALGNLGFVADVARLAVSGKSAGIDPSALPLALSSASGFSAWSAPAPLLQTASTPPSPSRTPSSPTCARAQRIRRRASTQRSLRRPS